MAKKLKALVTVMEYTPEGAPETYIGVFIDGGLSRGWAMTGEYKKSVNKYLCELEELGFKVPLGTEGYKLTNNKEGKQDV